MRRIFFSQNQENLDDSFYITQSLINYHSRLSSHSPHSRDPNHSFLPHIQRTEKCTNSFVDAGNHLARRKKKSK